MLINGEKFGKREFFVLFLLLTPLLIAISYAKYSRNAFFVNSHWDGGWFSYPIILFSVGAWLFIVFRYMNGSLKEINWTVLLVWFSYGLILKLFQLWIDTELHWVFPERL
jgi:hypothetical protein